MAPAADFDVAAVVSLEDAAVAVDYGHAVSVPRLAAPEARMNRWIDLAKLRSKHHNHPI